MEEVEVAVAGVAVEVEVMEEVMELEGEVVPYGTGGEVVKTVLLIIQQMMKVSLKMKNLIMVVI